MRAAVKSLVLGGLAWSLAGANAAVADPYEYDVNVQQAVEATTGKIIQAFQVAAGIPGIPGGYLEQKFALVQGIQDIGLKSQNLGKAARQEEGHELTEEQMHALAEQVADGADDVKELAEDLKDEADDRDDAATENQAEQIEDLLDDAEEYAEDAADLLD